MEAIKYNKKLQIAVLLVLVVIVLLIIGNKTSPDKKSRLLKGGAYVIEKDTSLNIGKLPIINIDSDEIEQLNNEIRDKYFETGIDNLNEYHYEYSVYNSILSLLIIIKTNDDTDSGEIYYYSYNIDIDNKKRLTNEELLDMINITNDEVVKKINEQLEEYHNKDREYSNISYNEYLEYLNINLDNNYELYINNKTLQAYKTYFITNSLELDESIVNPFSFNISKLR